MLARPLVSLFKRTHVRENTHQFTEQQPKTLQLARLQGLQPLGNRAQTQVGAQRVVLLRPSAHSNESACSKIAPLRLQPSNYALMSSISSPDPPIPVTDPDEETLMLRAAKFRLQAAQLGVQLLEKRVSSHEQRQDVQNDQASSQREQEAGVHRGQPSKSRIIQHLHVA
ncbi:hypothetical protein QAD02_002694 [Eretmocerus hayati]|uniref:Uncharacterized protein n=1 Tax=Eretmocerus hayati TaxID=131215 RepID=A0ACC2NJR4_9HYME|nr:hypothetical protein QAD02_002694 [Eretmocerus hayati]